jgi:cytochrome c peroxidase
MMKNPFVSILSLMRKLPRRFTISFLSLVFLLLAFQGNRNENKVDELYINQLDQLRQSLFAIKNSCLRQSSPIILKKEFLASRLIYKKVSVLIEYFNIYESKYLNAAAIERVEDDNPDKIIPPQGFQAIEQLLYDQWQNDNYKKIEVLIDGMNNIINRLKDEPDRSLKFKDELVLDAINAAFIRIITQGITAYDSPLALNSLRESAAILEGTQSILDLYKKEINKNDNGLFRQISEVIISAKKYLLNNDDFISFDRLSFITDYSYPLFEVLKETTKALNITSSAATRPLSQAAKNIFQKNAFNIDYFAPDKQYLPTPQRIQLGKQLFYDPILSQTRNQSCASCHKPELAFTDGRKTALSIDSKTSLKRNTPTLLNSALQTRQFWDSRADILENQLLDVVHNSSEMKGSLKQSITDLKNDPHYFQLFKKAYSKEPDPVTAFNIANAISSYIRSLLALNSRFDQYMCGDKTKLSEREKQGFNLFMGKAICGSCHFLPLFNGLVPPAFTETESEVLGVPQTTDKKNAVLDPDVGKYDFTKSSVHKFAFKTPTLRNIELTAPYMHNGVYKTLEEVLDFYNKGGGKGLKIAPENQTLPFDKLNLSKKEMKNIIIFLKALTDTAITKQSR